MKAMQTNQCDQESNQEDNDSGDLSNHGRHMGQCSLGSGIFMVNPKSLVNNDEETESIVIQTHARRGYERNRSTSLSSNI